MIQCKRSDVSVNCAWQAQGCAKNYDNASDTDKNVDTYKKYYMHNPFKHESGIKRAHEIGARR